uniref:Putative salivary lipocalin n=1 Tax=Amblyomma tuberculatum TaxID=48802 RepID=A0A6M2E5V1_9ACAR
MILKILRGSTSVTLLILLGSCISNNETTTKQRTVVTRLKRKSGSGHHFIYTLRVELSSAPKQLAAYDANFNTSITTQHLQDNAATYKFGPQYPAKLRKLMYINEQKTCAILVEDLSDKEKGCQLVQTELTVDQEIPEECSSVYDEKLRAKKNLCSTRLTARAFKPSIFHIRSHH